MSEIVGQTLIVIGSLVFGAAGLGILRLRDVFARLSAIATGAGLGMPLILVGVFLLEPSWERAVKLGIAVVLQLVTSAVASMAIARSAYLIGAPPVGGPGEVPDELADVEAERRDRGQGTADTTREAR
ncbi:monovalent cation/H(+) antiporter subunit G [Mobilicoccus sp.]|uniref:cation:proton antiporter n=1 Tax=Mobilicoccus sp. TaxID=2034349 RepID=UPI00289F8F70|nr:monovalent cation/H(+) antiporter subunit G [Mobilicoccus sp.]